MAINEFTQYTTPQYEVVSLYNFRHNFGLLLNNTDTVIYLD